MAKKKKQASNMLEVQNAAKTLFANIRFMSPDNPIRSIVMTSSVPNEGKSTCSVELARAIATSGKTVLLVEADMRRRTLASLLNVRPAAGRPHRCGTAQDGRHADADSQPVLPRRRAEHTQPGRHHLVQAVPEAGCHAGGQLRLCDLRHAAGRHLRRCRHPVHVGGRHGVGGQARLDEAFRAGGRVRAAEEGRCQHPRSAKAPVPNTITRTTPRTAAA